MQGTRLELGDDLFLRPPTFSSGKELWTIQSSLAIYKVIGLNVMVIHSAKAFLRFVQIQSLMAVALGLGRVFEREGAYELCSVGDVDRRTTPEAVAASLVRRAGWGRLPHEAPPEDGYSNARSRTLRATFVASKCSSAISRASRECRP